MRSIVGIEFSFPVLGGRGGDIVRDRVDRNAERWRRIEAESGMAGDPSSSLNFLVGCEFESMTFGRFAGLTH